MFEYGSEEELVIVSVPLEALMLFASAVTKNCHGPDCYIKIHLRKVTIYLLTSCNTEERIAQNIYIHNSYRNYKKLTTTTILIKIRFLINIVVVVNFL